MSIRRVVWLFVGVLIVVGGLFAFQRPFRVYRAAEGYDDLALPHDYQVPGELTLGRLMYPSAGRGGRIGGNWKDGGTNWTIDYPKGDRTFAVAIRRLSRVQVRSVEQPVDPDDADIFDWPYLHVSMPSTWNLSDLHVTRLREYFLRGGVMLCDSLFGTTEWAGFERGMKQIFPDRQIEELPNEDPLFHTVYNLKERIQVGNFRSMDPQGNHAYRSDGAVPHWRGIRDDQGRVMVFITFNNDLGDSWQLADDPRYPAKFSDMGIRLGVNWVTYMLTH